jgi:hypothetical protein
MKSYCSPVSLRAVFASVAAMACLCLAVNPAHAERLSGTVRPDHYTLTLTPDLTAATFSGVETIDVTLAEPSKTITLNSAEIDFKTVTVSAGGKQQTGAVSLDKDKEQATLTFPDAVPAGKATLSSLNRPMRDAPFLLSTSRHSRPHSTFRW